MLVAVQLSLPGLYLPPVVSKLPPQTIISSPVQIAVCSSREVGTLTLLVAVQLFGTGIIFSSGVQHFGPIKPTPNDHFSASPNGCMRISFSGRVRSRRGYPTVRAGIVSSAGVRRILGRKRSAPHDHFISTPHRRVTDAPFGRIDCAGSYPTVRRGVKFPARV